MKRFALVLFIMSTILITGCDQEAKRQKAHEDMEAVTRSMDRDIREQQMKNDQLEYENKRLELGDGGAARWDKCLHDPPKVKSNQVACAKFLAQVNAKLEAEEKAELAKQAKW